MGAGITPEQVKKRARELEQDADKAGYHLNADPAFSEGLVEGLLINETRYGYESCPCRLSYGDLEDDRDIICPCDYRDDDLGEFGACYCGLYVSENILLKKQPVPVVPERRPALGERKKRSLPAAAPGSLPYPVWRCKVCGYLCARTGPPEKCPICKAGKDRFETFLR